mgnify:CR=1 FL=1
MKIYAPAVAKKAAPGQFVILRSHNDGERIPLTVADYDRDEGSVTVIFQVVGAGTERLNRLCVGDSICDFVGPLGVATHLDGLKKVCIVGGGVGCAIAMPIAEKLAIKTGTLMWCIRIAVSGLSATPGGATEIMEVIGKEESLSRIDAAIAKLA